MYKKGLVKFGRTLDTQTDDYDSGIWAHLPHSCDDWVIGGVEEINFLIADLQILREEILKRPTK